MTASVTNYYSPTPLDFAVLGLLPDKAIIGGAHWAGRPVKHIVADLNGSLDVEVTGTDVVARLRSMKVAGYVEDFAATGSRIWARTAAGVEHLGKREEVLGL